MFTMTNKNLLIEYMVFSDNEEDVKNFRLYYQGKATSLVWYDGKIIFIPQAYFELKNLINVNLKEKYKCSLYLCDFQLIKELQSKEISFVMEDGLRDIFERVVGLPFIYSSLSNDVAIESIYDFNYDSIIEPIYLGDGSWINIDK